MSIKQHTSQYYLDIKFGEFGKSVKSESKRLDLQINSIDTLYIIQDINRLLPSFRLKFQDPASEYTQLTPSDNRLNKIRISFNRNRFPENPVTFNFDAYREFPTSDFLYDVEGFLQIKNLFSPKKIRGFLNVSSVTSYLTNLAQNELGVENVDISPSLDRLFQNIIQSNLTNAELLKYLKNTLLGTNNEAGFFCFIRPKELERTFVFRSLKELYSQTPKYFFTNSTNAFADSNAKKIYYPILDFKIYDNHKLLGVKGVKSIDYSYFDYNTTSFKRSNINVKDNAINSDDFLSLTKYFSVDENEDDVGYSIDDTGRTTESRSNFKGGVKNTFYKRLNNLSKFWLTSWGLEDIFAGDIVSVEYVDSPRLIGIHQYNGLWLVERVIHLLGSNFGTRLLLTRSGFNTSRTTSLAVVDNKNRVAI